jgi:hypothetical protein
MRLDVDPFPVNTVGYEGRKILVQIDQADTTRGKNVIVSNELWNRMIKLEALMPGCGRKTRRGNQTEGLGQH